MNYLVRKLLCLALTAALCLSFTACHGIISNQTTVSGSPDVTEETIMPVSGQTSSVGEFYGSYLTMYFGNTPPQYLDMPYIKVFDSYSEIEDYYNNSVDEFFYGMRFTLALYSFNDEYLAENDVMVLVINEPSSYVSHTADPVIVSDDGVTINVTRHMPENSPQHDTVYHLIFTAPDGTFDGIDELPLTVNISEVIDPENNTAFDAERFRYFEPEFYSYCYRADALIDNPEVTIDAIDGYQELVDFYTVKKDTYDLDTSFREYVGTLYNWQICERYILLVTIIPCADEVEPVTSNLFVNNLEIYMTIDANRPAEGEKPKACYLLLTAVERKDLEGVDLSSYYLNFGE